jgi:hypothetical protein
LKFVENLIPIEMKAWIDSNIINDENTSVDS